VNKFTCFLQVFKSYLYMEELQNIIFNKSSKFAMFWSIRRLKNFTWKLFYIWTPKAYACNPRYLAGCDLENSSSRTAWANISQDRISITTRETWAGGVAQALENQLCKHEAQSSNPVSTENHITYIPENVNSLNTHVM
jgi:hypothetical protein